MDQQWEPVVLRKKAPTKKTPANAAAIIQGGGQVDSVKKFNAGTNHNAGPSNARRLDDETEDFHHQKVPLELRKAIAQARQVKKMTQKDLATRLNEKVTVVNDYESGKAIPNNGMIARMEKILDCKLPRPKKATKPKENE
eukprot:c52897_g1_i1.p2 GENE.c52897_g1_i1~~c52897_g1_i1.p2  ORF type:complete len:151 (-),score=29.92 c52897_g1_i1:12-431(-)